jgi:hypothetical protein
MKWICDWAIVDCLVDFGRRIGLTHRIVARSVGSPAIIIAESNLRGVLKSKDNQVYRWCCYLTLFSLPSELLWRYLEELWWRHHTELSSIPEVKSFGSWEVTTTSTNLQGTKFLTVNWKHLKLRNRKCHLVTNERWLHSYGMSIATEARKANVILPKNL